MDKLIEEETGGEDVLEDRLPFLGVPFTVKEAFALQGNYGHMSVCLISICPLAEIIIKKGKIRIVVYAK